MYKKLKVISVRHLGVELKRIWDDIVEMKQSIAELKQAQIITTAEGISAQGITVDELIESTAPTETIQEEAIEVTEEGAEESKQDLTELESLKLKAEAMGIKVHHKAKIESIQRAIDEKEKA
jgi:hypothetical protein